MLPQSEFVFPIPPDPSLRRRQIAARIYVSLIGLTSIAATSVMVWDRVTLRVTEPHARAMVQTTDAAHEADRQSAVVILLRNARDTVEALQQLAARTGPDAEQARMALKDLRKQLSR